MFDANVVMGAVTGAAVGALLTAIAFSWMLTKALLAINGLMTASAGLVDILRDHAKLVIDEAKADDELRGVFSRDVN